MEWWQYGIVAGGAAAAFLTGAAAVYIKLKDANQKLMERTFDLEKRARDATIDEWKAIAQAKSDDFSKRAEAHDKRFALQETHILALQKSHAECEARGIIQAAEIKALQMVQQTGHETATVAPFSVVTVGKDGKILDASGATTHMFGRRAATLINQGAEILIAPSFREEHRVAISAAFERGFIKRGNETTTGRAVRENGSEFKAVISLSMVKDDPQFKDTVVTATIFELRQA